MIARDYCVNGCIHTIPVIDRCKKFVLSLLLRVSVIGRRYLLRHYADVECLMSAETRNARMAKEVARLMETTAIDEATSDRTEYTNHTIGEIVPTPA